MSTPQTNANDVWLTRKQVSHRGIAAEKTLANWAVKGLGPPFTRFGGGRAVRYRLSDVIDWENSQPTNVVSSGAA